MSDQQAYRPIGDPSAGNDEWNRLNQAMRGVTDKMATCTVVKVVAVRGRTVDVQPLVAQMDGAGNAVPHGTVHNVPVCRMQTAGVAIIIDPVPGDTGLVVFAHSDISTAKTTGAESPPGSKRRFDWADGIYVAGLFGTDEPTTTLTLSAAGGLVIASSLPVQINAPVEVMGGLTVDGVEFATHKHSGVTTGGAISGPVATP